MTVPVNWDVLTNLVLSLANTPAFVNFLAPLDGTGTSTATFDTFGPLPGATVGLTLEFAFAVGDNPWDYASIPVSIQILP